MENAKLPERINFDQCLNLPVKDHVGLPRCPAVYVVYASPDIALYIGATKALKNRWVEHGRTFKKIAGLRVAWFPLPVSTLRDVEREMIKQYRPVTNHNHRPAGSRYIFCHDFKELKQYIKERRDSISE